MSAFSPIDGENEWATANAAFEENITNRRRDADNVGETGAQLATFKMSFDGLASDAKALDVIVRDIKKPTGLSRLFSCFVKSFSDQGLENRALTLRISKLEMNDSILHRSILSRIYRVASKLPENSPDPPARGNHWEAVGFQGDDPRTDLRSTGMLGPLQLLYLFDKSPTLADQCISLAWEATHEYPFVLVGFNFSAITLDCIDSQAVISSCLNLEAKGDLHPLLESICFLYLGCWELFCSSWRGEKNTTRSIADFGSLKAEMKKKILSAPDNYIERGKSLCAQKVLPKKTALAANARQEFSSL